MTIACKTTKRLYLEEIEQIRFGAGYISDHKSK